MAPQNSANRHQPRFLTSRRVTITVPHAIFEALEDRSRSEGRSLSNLAAYLLEFQLDQR